MKILLLLLVLQGKEEILFSQKNLKDNFIYFAESPILQSALAYFPYLVDDNYQIEPGDSIQIKFFGNFNSSLKMAVPHTGSIVIAANPVFRAEKTIDTIPFLGKFNAKNKTVKEIENEIRHKLKEKYPDTDVTVYIKQLGSRLVHVVGDTPYPGYYAVSPLTRITGALLISGLTGLEVLKGSVYLIRNGKKTELNIEKYFDEGNLNENPYLKNGDIIIFRKK